MSEVVQRDSWRYIQVDMLRVEVEVVGIHLMLDDCMSSAGNSSARLGFQDHFDANSEEDLTMHA